MTDTTPVFICEIKPRADGGWDVFIKKEPRGDGKGSRHVGSYPSEHKARDAATQALYLAKQEAVHLSRKSFTMRSDEIEKS